MATRKFSSAALVAGYRSGLEEKIGDQLRTAGVEAEYEPFKISYEVPATKHKYTPDYVLPNGIIIETKGRFVVEDRKKHVLIKAQYPGLDIRFVFSNSKAKLRKGSQTTYADWCSKNGFTFADKLIPQDWLDESVRRTSIKIIKSIRTLNAA